MTMDAQGVYYRDLNEQIREAVAQGVTEFDIVNVKGQRYIATGLTGDLVFNIEGTPGQDLGAFMNGPYVRVKGNAQDGVGNTMDSGTVVIEGLAGDVLGYGMRGGVIHIHGDVGYRVGIHMKAFKEKVPVLVIGGKAGDFLGEYMAGGAIVLLGLYTAKPYAPICGRSLGTGMHGGVIYVRGEVPTEQLGPGLVAEPCDSTDMDFIKKSVKDFCHELGEDQQRVFSEPFNKVRPFSHRPYGNLYCAC